MNDQRRTVPYGKTVHGQEEIDAVVEVLRTSTQMGPKVRDFEEKVSALFAKQHGVMVNSGSSANYLAIRLLDLPPGSEVITPALTFATTLSPILQHGLRPVLADVAPRTFNVDADQVESLIGDATRALMIPNLIGNLPDWDRLRKLADAHDLLVVEDSADTLGATIGGKSSGTRSDISTTSFYGSHVINCAGNGGMICVNDSKQMERARLLRSWGRDSSLFVESERIENRFNVDLDGIGYDAKFVFSEIGFNFEPSELGAAFGLVQLEKLARNVEVREKWFDRHLRFFREWEHWLELPEQLPNSRTGWLAFALRVKEEAPFTRRELQIALETQGVQTRPVFTGNVLRQPGFRDIDAGRSPGGYPVADAVMRGGMLLGCHHGLSDADVDYVHERFREYASGF